MKRPRDGSIVHISGHEYVLKYQKDLVNDEGTPLWGHYRVGTREILVEKGLPTPANNNTVLHEIVHGILEHAGIDQAEPIANAVAYGLESVRINGKPILR